MGPEIVTSLGIILTVRLPNTELCRVLSLSCKCMRLIHPLLSNPEWEFLANTKVKYCHADPWQLTDWSRAWMGYVWVGSGLITSPPHPHTGHCFKDWSGHYIAVHPRLLHLWLWFSTLNSAGKLLTSVLEGPPYYIGSKVNLHMEVFYASLHWWE